MRPILLDASLERDLASIVHKEIRNSDIVVIRNMFGIGGNLLSAYEYQNFMSMIGRMWTTDDELKAETKFQLPGYPAIIELTHDGLLGSKALPLHSDASHHPARPYPSRSLYPVELPDDESATTSWYSMTEALNTMGGPFQQKYRDVVCWHEPAYGTGWAGRWAKLIELDPWSGTEYLAFDEIFIKRFNRLVQTPWGKQERTLMDSEEVEDLKKLIRGCIMAPYVHVWKPGDLVIWNNRGTVHSRTQVTPGKARRMWRITFDRN